MTEKEFRQKWGGGVDGYWVTDISTLFWAKSYNMPSEILVEMSRDYLRCNPINGDSSYSLACHTLREHCYRFRTYGLASLYSL